MAVIAALATLGAARDGAARVTSTRPRRRPGALSALYARAARDIRAGRPLVVTVHVALCDNGQLACGRGKLGDGARPRGNVYWGGGAGLRAFFDHRWGYKRVHVDKGDGARVLERVVYRRRVRRPSRAWRRLGVRRGFDIYLVGVAWSSRAIAAATGAFIGDVAGSRAAPKPIKLRSGQSVRYGSAGHVVGYAGHNHLMDVVRYRFPNVSRAAAVGYFALSCRNAQYIAGPLAARTTHALLLSRVLMYPGAFTIDGLVRGLAAGASGAGIYRSGAYAYARYQKRSKRWARLCFLRQGERRFERYRRSSLRLWGGRSPR